MSEPIRTHAAPLFKELRDRAASGEVDRDDLRRLVNALQDALAGWRLNVDTRLDQIQSAGVMLRDRVVVLEGRADALEAAVVSLEARVTALEGA